MAAQPIAVAISHCKLFDAYDGRGAAAYHERQQRRVAAAKLPVADPQCSTTSLSDLAENCGTALTALGLPGAFGVANSAAPVKVRSLARTPRRYTALLLPAALVPQRHTVDDGEVACEDESTVADPWQAYWRACVPTVAAEFESLRSHDDSGAEAADANDSSALPTWTEHVAARYTACWVYFQSWQSDTQRATPEINENTSAVDRVEPVTAISVAKNPEAPSMSDSQLSRKYWQQRYRFFSRFDEGIMIDEEGWYSVTPEIIAEHLSRRCQGDFVVDGFCGVGGNTIQLAMTCHRVLAIDIDPHKIACARHNARLYGVEDRVDFVIGDFFDVMARLQLGAVDAVFMSPPWGGPDYINTPVYDLGYVTPDARRMFDAARAVSDNVAMLLPRNVNLQQLVELAAPVEVEEQFINGKFKTVTAYWGDLIDVPEFLS